MVLRCPPAIALLCALLAVLGPALVVAQGLEDEAAESLAVDPQQAPTAAPATAPVAPAQLTSPAAPRPGQASGPLSRSPEAAQSGNRPPSADPVTDATGAAGGGRRLMLPDLPLKPQPATSAPQEDVFDQFPFAPDPQILIETEILPMVNVLADDAQRLQNALIRHCLSGSRVTRRALSAVFVNTIADTARIVPLSFGSPQMETVPQHLLTETASTVFSRTQIDAFAAGLVVAPRTLSGVRAQEAGLRGLSALERLMLAPRYGREQSLRNRCDAALGIVAHVSVTAYEARRTWRYGDDLEPHWTPEERELADRLRLRDLVQGAIDAIDRIDRDVTEWQRRRRNNEALPFAHLDHSLPYLLGLGEGLHAHMRRLAMYTEPGSPPEMALSDIATALEVGMHRLKAAAAGEDADYLTAFDQAHADIIDRLPSVFGFDGSAFDRGITSFELLRTGERTAE